MDTNACCDIFQFRYVRRIWNIFKTFHASLSISLSQSWKITYPELLPSFPYKFKRYFPVVCHEFIAGFVNLQTQTNTKIFTFSYTVNSKSMFRGANFCGYSKTRKNDHFCNFKHIQDIFSWINFIRASQPTVYAHSIIFFIVCVFKICGESHLFELSTALTTYLTNLSLTCVVNPWNILFLHWLKSQGQILPWFIYGLNLNGLRKVWTTLPWYCLLPISKNYSSSNFQTRYE